VAADLWTKPIGLNHTVVSPPVGCQLTLTIAIYYYSARKPMLILPSHGG